MVPIGASVDTVVGKEDRVAVTLEQVRTAALSLPEVREADHHGHPSFRVSERILATVPDEVAVNIMVGEDEARAAVQDHPAACQLLWWGPRLSGVRVELSGATLDVVTELLAEAWHRRAPARLHRAKSSGETTKGA